jgi:hypothetical protein
MSWVFDIVLQLDFQITFYVKKHLIDVILGIAELFWCNNVKNI